MDKDHSPSCEPVRLILVVPLGVDSRIFPWGVHSIKDYLQHYFAGSVDIHIWDMPRDIQIEEFIKENLPLINELNSLWKKGDEEKFMLTNPLMRQLSILCCSGEEFISICKEEKILYRRMIREGHLLKLKVLKEKFNSCIDKKISALSNNRESGKTMWAFSVYDSTLFNCLYVASIIKRDGSKASLIFGGDYFDIKTAKELAEKVAWIDGVVIGYGEEVMKIMIENWRHGIRLSEMKIKGLINLHVITDNSQDSSPPRKNNAARTMLMPVHYENRSTPSPVSYVKYFPESKKVRILTQRGCGFGQCTFCTQFDRYLRYDINKDYLVTETQRVLREIIKDGISGDTYTIMIDSDANDPGNLIPLLNCLKDINLRGIKFKVWFWLRVGQVTQDLAQFLLSIKESNIDCFVALGIESLNPKTLKNMRKGVTHLHILEAMKMIVDCGGFIRSNYFTFFPLEGIDDVADEVNIFRRAGHLLCPPKVAVSMYPYGANIRDTIFNSQDDFNVIVEPLIDFWMKRYFKVELPASIFSSRLVMSMPKSLRNSIFNSYFKINYIGNKTGASFHAALAAKGLFNKVMFGFSALYVKRTILFYLAINLIQQILARDFNYWHRIRFFRYLRKLPYGTTEDVNNDAEQDTVNKMNFPTFCLKGQTLIKRFEKPFPFPETWSDRLDETELRVMRYLYFRRKEHELFSRFSMDISRERLLKILEKHIRMGTVLHDMNSYLAIFNDPEYWNIRDDNTGR